MKAQSRMDNRGYKFAILNPRSSIFDQTLVMMHGTTIFAIRHGGTVVVVGDGQVSLGQTVLKHSARKVRKRHHDRVIAGCAGATAAAYTLSEKFQGKLELFNGNPKRAGVA